MIRYAVKYLKNTFVPLNGANELDNLDGKLILARTDKGEEVLKAFLVNTEIGKLFEESKKTPEAFEFLRVEEKFRFIIQHLKESILGNC